MKRLILTVILLVIGSFGCKHATEKGSTSNTSSVAPSASIGSSASSNQKWNVVEKFDYVRKSSKSLVHFTLELPEKYEDPGTFIRMRISAQGQSEFILDNQDGWIEYVEKEKPPDIFTQLNPRNEVKSKNVLIIRDSAREDDAELVILRSWGYASESERLHVVAFNPTGQPIVLVNSLLRLIDVTDLDGDGFAEIIGLPCLSQGFGNDLLTYDPIHVLKIPHPITSPASLSLSLSKPYNLEHYYGWAGPDCSEALAVVLHPPNGGKPVILKTEEAEKLMEIVKASGSEKH